MIHSHGISTGGGDDKSKVCPQRRGDSPPWLQAAVIATKEFAVRARDVAVRWFALPLLAMAMFVSACSGAASSSPSTAQPSTAASSAPASAPLNTASAAAPASAAPSVAATSPPVSPSPGGPVYLKSGTATVQFTVGSKKASIKVPLDVRMGQPRIDEDGSLDAQWDNLSNNSITEGLQLVIPKGKSGTYAVDYNNNYVTFYVEILQSDVEHVSCKVALKRTSTGGIAGTVDCKGRLRVMLDPVTAKGTFSAEP